MPHHSRGRAVGGELVSYRRRSVDPLAKPDAARDRAISSFHASDCDCPRCVAERALERDDTPPDAA
jgi:hypothetical protein